jgi:glycosyltransferase involved in cell wall biosynthesis
MPIKELIRSHSLGGFATTYEKKGMKFIDFFSLPSKERLEFYPGINLPVFVIPNYPSLKVYKDYSIERKAGNSIRIIYQGFIGKGHSLEQMIEAIGKRTKDLKIELILKGSVTEEYKIQLNRLACDYGVGDQIVWIPVGPYKELPSLTESCHIGIGMNWNTDMVNKNQGTASNKIYEYAASGVPVILADTPQFRQYLGKYSWAFFSDGSVDSLEKVIREICIRNTELAVDARSSFEKELNFEKVFVPVMEEVMTSIIGKGKAG